MRGFVRRAVVAYAKSNRRRKAQGIQQFSDRVAARTVIFVGASAGSRPQDGIVENYLASHTSVLSVCNVVPSGLPWPSVVGDGRRLPYRDAAADLVVSNAVIEHVGDERDQAAFVAEHVRVGRAWALTTPNRWFPVEPHTFTLVRHWSPAWRRRQPAAEFTRLLSRRELQRLLPTGSEVIGHWWSPTFTAVGPGGGSQTGSLVSTQ